MNDLISIIIPVFNSGSYLSRCLDSILNQSYTNFEAIIIDDGSIDNSWDIISFYTNKDKRFRPIKQDNHGVSNARNSGLKIAQGKYVGFVDSDDYISKYMFEIMAGLLENNQADISIVSFDCGKKCSEKKYIMDGVQGIIEMNRGTMFMGHLHNKLFKRALFDNLSFDETIAIQEDLLILHPVFFKAERIVFYDIPLYFYQDRPDSAMNGAFKDSYLTRRTAAWQIVDFFKNNIPQCIEESYYTLVLSDISVLNKLSRAKKHKDKKYAPVVKDIIGEIREFASTSIIKKFKSRYIRFLIRTVKVNKRLYLMAILLEKLLKK